MVTDIKGNIEYVNSKFIQITGYSREEVVGQNPRILKSGQTPPEEYKRLWETITAGGEWQGEFYNKKKTGELYLEYAYISPIRNSEGVITHFLAVKEDITKRKRAESQLVYLADRDPLTNLFNRRRFLEELEVWLAQAKRYQIQGALLFIDVDNFKYINDTLGHQSGDVLLKTLADLLQKKLRNTDVLARMGGDEFAIILPYVELDKAQLVARDILEVMRYRTTADTGAIPVTTASIGIALFPEHGSSGETLLMCADLAMYMAKEEGRNRFCVYTPQQKTQIESRLIWKKRICDALKEDRFVLHLQPIIDLQQDSIAGYEALLRMIDEKGNLIPPADFLDSAERFGLICEIDRWVVKRAIHIIVEIYHAGTSQFLEVNLSSKSILDPEFLSIIKQELHTTGTSPSHFVMGISESVFVENRDGIQHFIASFKTIGCRFALDNFGTGLSTFIQHKQLLADYLKIDGSFIRNLPHSPADQHLVKAMVEVARGLGKKTVAMFVSNNETMRLLREFGVDYAQGYFIGQPKAISEM